MIADGPSRTGPGGLHDCGGTRAEGGPKHVARASSSRVRRPCGDGPGRRQIGFRDVDVESVAARWRAGATILGVDRLASVISVSFGITGRRSSYLCSGSRVRAGFARGTVGPYRGHNRSDNRDRDFRVGVLELFVEDCIWGKPWPFDFEQWVCNAIEMSMDKRL